MSGSTSQQGCAQPAAAAANTSPHAIIDLTDSPSPQVPSAAALVVATADTQRHPKPLAARVPPLPPPPPPSSAPPHQLQQQQPTQHEVVELLSSDEGEPDMGGGSDRSRQMAVSNTSRGESGAARLRVQMQQAVQRRNDAAAPDVAASPRTPVPLRLSPSKRPSAAVVGSAAVVRTGVSPPSTDCALIKRPSKGTRQHQLFELLDDSDEGDT
jgi:hypothetical protein